jgi:hypothetical protein
MEQSALWVWDIPPQPTTPRSYQHQRSMRDLNETALYYARQTWPWWNADWSNAKVGAQIRIKLPDEHPR